MLLFPSETETKGSEGEERSAPVKSWHDDGFPPFGINRLDVFYEPITLDREKQEHTGAKKRSRGWGWGHWFGLLIDIYIIKGRNNNRLQDFFFSNCSDATLH